MNVHRIQEMNARRIDILAQLQLQLDVRARTPVNLNCRWSEGTNEKLPPEMTKEHPKTT